MLVCIEYFCADLGIGRMYGDIERRTSAQDAFELAVTDIGKRDVVTHHIASAPVVILKIKCITHSFGELIDKAEDTFIGTGVAFAVLEFDTELFVVGLLYDIEIDNGTVGFSESERKLALNKKNLVIDIIVYDLSVDRKDLITGRNTDALSECAFFYRGYFKRH